jgi:hypothetical protein
VEFNEAVKKRQAAIAFILGVASLVTFWRVIRGKNSNASPLT